MIEIPLTNGKISLIDAEDANQVQHHQWHCDSRHMPCEYAYIRPRINGRPRRIFMHRLLLEATPGQIVDHINGNGLDNRRSNLRLCSHSQNQANRQTLSRNTSGVKGVTWNKSSKKWQAAIKVNGRSYYLGIFDRIEDAGHAYDEAAIYHFGEFALTNRDLNKVAA